MPLEHSASQPAFKRNVSTLMNEYKAGTSAHVKSPQQALAIAYSEKRRAGHASGGVANYDEGGAVQSVIAALQQGATSGTSGPAAAPGTTNQAAPSSPAQTATTNNGVVPNQAMPTSVATPPTSSTMTPAMGVAQNVTPAPVTPIAKPLMASGGALNRAFGGAGLVKTPNMSVPWQERQEARNMTHVGPILSTVPGRTDHHATQVPSGSYVLPASHLASLGQGNSMAGLAIAHKMFGSGPYGGSAMKMTHGPGVPRPPKMGMMHSGGGKGGNEHIGVPTPVQLSGGEYVISPHEIIRRWGTLKKGHAALDKWIMETRKREIKIQRNLPPPAKK